MISGTYASGITLTNTVDNPVIVSATGSISTSGIALLLYGIRLSGLPEGDHDKHLVGAKSAV